MSNVETIGDRMKAYEEAETGKRFMPLIPVMARVDGRAFHSYTRGMDRPYDVRFVRCMHDTAIALLAETDACTAYVQSDEISLVWLAATTKSQIWFDGRAFKMTSQLGAIATLEFNRVADSVLPYYAYRKPTFDARVWQVPSKAEAVNTFLWRELDATRNSILMAAQHIFGHKKIMGKKCDELHDMLMSEGVNWNNYPAYFKRGTYFQRKLVRRTLSPQELANLPEKHEARRNPDMVVLRAEIQALDMPPLSKVTNREHVIFDRVGPMLAV